MRTILRVAVPIAGALLLAAGAIAVTASAAGIGVGSLFAASTPSPKPSPSPAAGAGRETTACQDFLGHLAKQLGVSTGKLDSAAVAAAKQTIEDQVASGQLTRAQADKIEAKLSAGNLCSFGAGAAAKPGEGGALHGATHDYLAAAASALGISESQLMSDLKGGQTLSQVAAAQGVTEDQFKSKVVAILKPKLDALVSAGKLTQGEEDAMLSKFQAGDPPLWNGAPHRTAPSPTPSPAV